MAESMIPTGKCHMLTVALKEIEPDVVYYGALLSGVYIYHGIGNRKVEFPVINSHDKKMFAEKMTGGELAAAIDNEIAIYNERESRLRQSMDAVTERFLDEVANAPRYTLKLEDGEWQIPLGATHFARFHQSNPLFYKMVPNGIGEETGEQFKCWAHWSGRSWSKDISVSSRNFVEIDYATLEADPKELEADSTPMTP